MSIELTSFDGVSIREDAECNEHTFKCESLWIAFVVSSTNISTACPLSPSSSHAA
jgi:hypothetical protein